jgi:hypothetical protein
MAIVHDEKRLVDGWRVIDCLPELREKYGVRFGERQIFLVLRLTDVIDENNNVLGRFQKLGLFKHRAIGIETDTGKRVKEYRVLYVTRKGIEFLGKHLRTLPNIPLSKSFCEFLKQFKIMVRKKGGGNQ